MFNPFALLRHRNEPEIQAIKKEHRATTRKAKKSVKDINAILTNGFAIKVYKAHGGTRHGNS